MMSSFVILNTISALEASPSPNLVVFANAYINKSNVTYNDGYTIRVED